MREVVLVSGFFLCLVAPVAAQEVSVEPAEGVDPDAVAPMPAWAPVGDGFEARVRALAAHVKKTNPTNDHRVFNLMVKVTARSGSRSWLGREVWSDGKVRFAVGRLAEMVDPLAAIQAAEALANAALDGVETSTSRRLLDWYIDDEGVAYALVGRWLTLEEQGLPSTP